MILFAPFVVRATDVGSFDELTFAINNGENEIAFTSDIEFNGTITISSEIKIDGNNHNFNRKDGYTGKLFNITSTGTLELKNTKMDLGAPGWWMDYDNRYYTQANNKGYVRVPIVNGDNDITATASLITNAGNLKMDNVEIRNGRSTASGTVISGAGNNELKDVTMEHIFSSKNGGMLYVSGGTTKLENFNAKDGAIGIAPASVHGAVIYIIGATLLDVENAVIEDNFTQGNGTFFISKTNTVMNNITFKHNMCGNDGSAISMESSVDGKTFFLTNGVFDGNIGFADTGQSMGTIWLAKWPTSADSPLEFKNVVFKNNKNKCGAGIADIGNSSPSYVLFDNVEVFNNGSDAQTGAFIYGQTVNYIIKNSKFHDNHANSGGVIFSLVSNFDIDNSEFYDNSTLKAGGAIYASGGNVKIANSTINDNTSGSQGGGIFLRAYYPEYTAVYNIENSIIKDNNANEGGGIAMVDYNGLYSSLIIDDQTKLYDNTASTSGDDFQYKRGDDIDITESNTLTLDNISIAGIRGIDGWYVDAEDDRFATTDNPTQFNDYVNFNGTRISLKAAGISTIDYDLEGGSNDNIEVVTIKYGVETQISDDVPEKEGYLFTGWNTEENGGGTDVQPGSTYDGKGGLLLYAQYVEDKNKNGIDDSTENHYIVKFLSGENGVLTGEVIYDNILTGLSFSEAGVDIPTISANEGYKSLGWDIEVPEKIESDLVFTAIYQNEVVENPDEVVENIDEVIEAPKTLDDIYIWIVNFFVSIFGFVMAVMIIFWSKRWKILGYKKINYNN